MRTNLNDAEVDVRVKQIINRLGLEQCKDTIVGGWMQKGLSGGERKRTSIGYEMITDPSLLLLDEPTSGLDSSTSLRILKTMRKEANRGMTILMTIHQPSSAIFMLFDRVIVLSEGYCIFNGAPREVKSHFCELGMPDFRYANPADKLSVIASEPKLSVNKTATI